MIIRSVDNNEQFSALKHGWCVVVGRGGGEGGYGLIKKSQFTRYPPHYFLSRVHAKKHGTAAAASRMQDAVAAQNVLVGVGVGWVSVSSRPRLVQNHSNEEGGTREGRMQNRGSFLFFHHHGNDDDDVLR